MNKDVRAIRVQYLKSVGAFGIHCKPKKPISLAPVGKKPDKVVK